VPEARRVVKRAVVTEKSVAQTGGARYTFAVDSDASKHKIKSAVEQIFKVKVLRVNTISVHGKSKRDLRRRTARATVKQPDWKKAIVTLKEGDKIELGGVNYFES